MPGKRDLPSSIAIKSDLDRSARIGAFSLVQMKPLKLQTTVRGYSAWVIDQLMIQKGETLADVAKYVLDRWVDDNAEFLDQFAISRQNFMSAEEGRGMVFNFDQTDTH